ncbi:4Fe-4S dicluster domain-containing protein [Nitratidesulfovibrio liaohensis]|uniref:Ferredoxin n=1 Tax=Nitratidesulfovibrio liaohensis TaxID=2604158 RepID=A0ABY9R5V4_9BACT|nr:4Fe-4S dicluster domain-containing protein [Nitratidesulfovibrio liaohensis]WMW66592.1 ferredoxin [Nitratidesulfovibrio liaohensis]
MKTTRNILEIDEERCDGCGACVLDCAEGAIAIVDGKAKIVSDSFCDGLGACLGSCPQGALRIIQRDAVPFDEEAAMEHVRKRDGAQPRTGDHHSAHSRPDGHGVHGHYGQAHQAGQGAGHGAGQGGQAGQGKHGGCPGSMIRSFAKSEAPMFGVAEGPVSGPGHWPLKIRLVPPTAPYLKDADVLVAADCAAAASPLFHSHFAGGKVVLIGCPKFDDTDAYAQRLAEILVTSGIRSMTVLRMEVPCCRGLTAALAKARELSGTDVPLNEMVMTCQGAPAPTPLA